MHTLVKSVALFAACLSLTACGDSAKLPVSAGTGHKPQLPAPNPTMLPTLNTAAAIGWGDEKPVAANGLQVNAFAKGFQHPRWVYVLPNGDVLVAETNAPPKPDDATGVRGFVQGMINSRTGESAPGGNRITLLRDTNGDGIADVRTIFIANLHSPFGMALVGNDFYVADSDALLRFTYHPGDTHIDGAGTKVTDLPAGRINHHWTKNVIASPDGSKLYVTVGSNSNVGENGIAAEKGRAAIWEVDPATGHHRIFASGLRNPNGMAWVNGMLWTAVNERDEIGSDLVPDYITSVKDGAFYGWPYSYYGQHVDVRMQPQRPDLVAKAIAPDFAVGPHTASLGLASSQGAALGDAFASGLFVGQHGSWNRNPFSGYKVIFVPFANGQPSGMPVDVLTGFLTPSSQAHGRPVGVAVAKDGALLVADDVGNTVWRVSKK